MTTLAKPTSDGRLSFTKYVTDNPAMDKTIYRIERELSTPLFDVSRGILTQGNVWYEEDAPITIIDPHYHEIDGIKFARCEINGTEGYIPINKIRKPTQTNSTQYEDAVVDIINAWIQNNGGSIDIRLIGDTKVYRGLRKAIKIDRSLKRVIGARYDPKADIIICRDPDKPFADDTVYLSHKKEGGPNAFQQYSGITNGAGREIYQHDEVKEFFRKLAEKKKNNIDLRMPVMAYVQDHLLSCLAIFGPEFGQAHSAQNVQLIGQGDPVFTPSPDGIHELKFSSHTALSGNVEAFLDGYTPILASTYRADRHIMYEDVFIDRIRVGVYPKAQIMIRRNVLKL